MLRYARHCYLAHRAGFEAGRNTPSNVEEQITLLTFLINHHVHDYLTPITAAAEAPVNAHSYGELVSGLAWRYLRFSLARGVPEHVEQHEAALLSYSSAFDTLTAYVQSGQLRLPPWAYGNEPRKSARRDHADGR
ncbi:hypothetical protein [Nocardia brasiliensis]|uniref:hypothetical protein n=1 Tax=Nocardia brasiliensis TaxID=37326 RepID=UPI002454FE8C|nr:hypothetical protein [Nocardia brasiliensis]